MSNKKQFVVWGLGRFGSSIALTLTDLGHEVLGIDNVEEVVQSLSKQLTHVVLCDTMDEATVASLGIRNFDVGIVGMADLESSLLCTMLFKEAGLKTIVAKASTPLHGKMLEKIGADRVVYPERDMGQRVAHSLISSNVLDYIELSPNLSLVEVTAPSLFVGKSLLQSNMRAIYGVNVVAIKRKEKLIVPPQPTEVIQESDILIVIGSTDGLQKLEVLA